MAIYYLFILHPPDTDTKAITTFKKIHVNCLNSELSFLWEDPLVKYIIKSVTTYWKKITVVLYVTYMYTDLNIQY